MTEGHGDDTYRYGRIRANFSSNVYAHFNHAALYAHLATRLQTVNHYPEPVARRLEAELAAAMGLEERQVVVTNGATEAIYLVAQTMRRSRSAILQPAFAEYADACRLHEHRLAAFYRLEDLPAEAEVAWICNPGNPTGAVLEREALLDVMERRRETLFVLDASYAPYTLKPLVEVAVAAEMPNVVMLHSMTKEYGIPGLRLGYLTACAALAERIGLQRQPWAVNTLAQEAGLFLLRHREDYVLPVEELLEERHRMAAALQQLGVVEVWPSDTHILLCRLRMGNAASLKEYLAERCGLLIRDAGNFEGLDERFFRIAVQSVDEDDALLRGIGEWMSL